MKVRRGAWVATLGFLFSTLVATSASADQLKLDYATNNLHYGGGAFQATLSDNGPLGAQGTTFNTFCLETNEYFSPGGIYNYAVNSYPGGNSAAVNGGVGGGNPDPISLGTAYLYNKYLNDGANYDGAAQQALQQAIWWLEDETGEPCNTACHDMLTAAEVALGTPGTPLTDAQLKANANGAYGVVALNLTDSSNGSRAQDQLGRVPEAGATLLLSMGLAGLAWFARRKNLLPSGVRPLNV